MFSSWFSLVTSNSDNIFFVLASSSRNLFFSSMSLCWMSSFSALLFSNKFTFLWITSLSLSLVSSFCFKVKRFSLSYSSSWRISLVVFSSSSFLSASVCCLESESLNFLSIFVSLSFKSLFSASVLSIFSFAFANFCCKNCSFDSPLSLAISSSAILSSAALNFFSKAAIFSLLESKDACAFSRSFSISL